jgi:hypothetical protein
MVPDSRTVNQVTFCTSWGLALTGDQALETDTCQEWKTEVGGEQTASEDPGQHKTTSAQIILLPPEEADWGPKISHGHAKRLSYLTIRRAEICWKLDAEFVQPWILTAFKTHCLVRWERTGHQQLRWYHSKVLGNLIPPWHTPKLGSVCIGIAG